MEDWYEKEPSLRHQLTTELQRMARRARGRPIIVLLAASLVTALLVWYVSKRSTLHDGRVLMRVSESVVSNERTPLPRRGLRDYVTTLSFTKKNLLTVIDDLELIPEGVIINDDLAVQKLRGGIKIRVYRNLFARLRTDEYTPRSVQLSVHFYHSDPQRAHRVAKRLSQLIIESEQERRGERRALGLMQAETKVEAARERLMAKRKAIAIAGLELADATGDIGRQATIRFRLLQLEGSAGQDRTVLRAANREQRAIQVNSALADEDLGLRFTVLDDRPPPVPSSKRNLLILIGIMGFLVMLPVSIITIGVFDSRVHDREDVKRLGFEVVGHVPRFEGDDVGSMRSRIARRDRVN